MKILISLDEIKQLVTKQFGISGDFELEVVPHVASPTIRDAFNAADTQMALGNKIAAVKIIRTANPNCGLWEAKTIVENLPSARERSKNYSVWPMPIRDGFNEWRWIESY